MLYHITSFRKVHTSVLDYSKKKKKRGGAGEGMGGLRTWKEIAIGFSGG